MSGADDRRGFALILAIWALAAVALVTTTLATGVRRETTLTRNALDGASARHLADAAIHLVTAAMSDPATAGNIRIDGTPAWMTVEGAAVEVRVLDEGGKIDLNEAPSALLQGLLVGVGTERRAAEAIAAAIVAWRNDRLAAARASPIGTIGFESLGELARIAGITPGLFLRLEPYLTVESRQPAIDPWVAPAVVLAAVPGLDARSADALARDRPPAFYGKDAGRLAAARNPLFSPSFGTAFGIEATAEIAGLSFTRRAVVAPGRNGGAPRWLSWR
ncbi:general secretion pathway protein GspK [Desertibaculum subflavum]|uniref:general secretion pathway protein GspK n=1 Tax=Desertibaculum subflavum TaxID=2268458 RepID=UPI000E65EF42